MKSILHDIYCTFYPSNNVLSDHLSIEIPISSDEDFDHTEQFNIDQFQQTLDSLNSGQKEPSICIRGLSVIIKLFRTHTAAIREDYNRDGSNLDSLFRTITELLDYRNSILDEIAQNDEYVNAFGKFIPQKLRGFELIWRNVFDYHRSIAQENRMICSLGCEVLLIILECLEDDRRRNHTESEDMLINKVSQSTFVLALSSVMGSMHKYGEDDDIMLHGAGGICIIVSRITDTHIHLTSASDYDNEVLIYDTGIMRISVDKGESVLVLEPLRLVTKAVRSHISSISFITDFCKVISSLDSNSRLYVAMTHPTVSLCDEFVDILRDYYQDRTLTYFTLQIIKNLLDQRLNNIQDRISSVSSIETTVMAVNLHILDITVVLEGCEVLSLLALHSPSNRILLGAAGACEAVDRAFSKHSNTFKQQGKCRPLVRALAYGNTDNKNKLLYLGAGDFVPQLNVSGWLDGDEIEQGGDY